MNKLTVAPLFLLLLSACAQDPRQISPAQTPTYIYKNLSCEDLRKESVRMKSEETRLWNLQKKARNNDVAAGILFGLVGVAAANQNYSSELAQAQGQRLSVNATMAERGCNGIAL